MVGDLSLEVPGAPALLVGAGVALLTVLLGLAWLRSSHPSSRPGVPRTSGFRPRFSATDSDPFVYGSAQERRRAVRRRGSTIVVECRDPTGDGVSWRAYVQDRSPLGLGLEMDRSVPVGTLLQLRAVGAAAEIPWVAVAVRHSTPRGQSWLVGCQFVQGPTSGILWQFG